MTSLHNIRYTLLVVQHNISAQTLGSHTARAWCIRMETARLERRSVSQWHFGTRRKRVFFRSITLIRNIHFYSRARVHRTDTPVTARVGDYIVRGVLPTIRSYLYRVQRSFRSSARIFLRLAKPGVVTTAAAALIYDSG